MSSPRSACLRSALIEGRDLQIGDLDPGIAELRPDSRYNQDSAYIARHFAIGVDVLQVIVETAPDGCIDHDVMTEIDRFQWHMANLPGVRSTLSLPQVAKTIHAGWNEGSLKWRVLPRNESSLAQAIAPIETSSGLLNADCSAMPVLIFAQDHKADTIDRIVDAVESYAAANGSARLTFRLATGNLAVMAATNDVVEAAQLPILLSIYAAIIGLCLLTFRSLRAALCIVLPLALVSVLVYGLMAALGIGLRLSTLPVAALAVGIGVDYGIYVYSRLDRLPGSGAGARPGLPRDASRDRQGGAAHRADPGARRQLLGVLGAAVPGRHGHPSRVRVSRQYAGRAAASAGAGAPHREHRAATALIDPQGVCRADQPSYHRPPCSAHLTQARPSMADDRIRVISPANGEVLVERPLAGDREIEQALARARRAQADWRAVPVAERAAILGRAVDAFVARKAEIAAEITRQMGRPIRYTPSEVGGFEERARYMIGVAGEALADVEVGEQGGLHALHPAHAARRGVRDRALELPLSHRGQRRSCRR